MRKNVMRLALGAMLFALSFPAETQQYKVKLTLGRLFNSFL